MTPMDDPEREPAHFSASVRIGRRNPGFGLDGDAARLLAVVMALCTVIVAAEILAGIAWLTVRAV
jgi:hypothetical protein